MNLIIFLDLFCFHSYGDRCPQSFGGRLFAVLWILVGICVCSIFTASLTSSLTTLSMETKLKLPGAKVGPTPLFEVDAKTHEAGARFDWLKVNHTRLTNAHTLNLKFCQHTKVGERVGENRV